MRTMNRAKNVLRNISRILTLLLLCGPCLAQENTQPFASVDAAFQRSRLRWSAASGPFQTVRTQLGDNFEPELWRYLGDDVHKQDNIANFLTYPGYLHGNLPMPDLARRIYLKSLSLLNGKTDLSSRVAYVTASINAAVESAELDLAAEAQQHKSDAQRMLAADKFLLTAVPAMEDYDNCVYDAIGNSKDANPASACLGKKAASDTKVTMIEVGEIPAESIVSKPKPQWPKGAKAGAGAGTLKVQVVIDGSGRVESAEALGGAFALENAALDDAALAAARKARFERTMYQGDAVKVRGWLTYAY
jgi:TonB family protein